jgi:hypothetical protein
MAQIHSSDRSRWLLIASALAIGLVSLVQIGCGDSSSTPPPPTITEVYPQQSNDAALVSTFVAATFGVDMDDSTINSSTFTLTRSGGSVQAAVINYNPANRTAFLDPNSDLISGAEYIARISTLVEDTGGNRPLVSDFVWSFTVTPATTLVSKDSDGAVGNNVSKQSAIDETGRYIVFESQATNLSDAATTFNRNHIYRKDTVTGEVLLVSSDDAGLEANNDSFSPRISDDGRYVVFESIAKNLSSIPTDGISRQVFIKDLADTDQTDGEVNIELVSRDATGLVAASTTAANPDVSNDGRYIVFESAATILPALPANSISQIYLKDMLDDSVDMISQNTTQTAGGTGDSNRPAMSPGGQYIVFDSEAGSSIVSGATPTRSVYIYDSTAATLIELVSVDNLANQGNGVSINASVSDDGNYVVFESLSDNLTPSIVPGDTNGVSDVFLRDRSGSETILISTPDGNTSGNAASSGSSISADGAYIAFESFASDLVFDGTNGLSHIFVRDLSSMPTVTIEKINIPQSFIGEATNNSTNATISADGRYVSFDSAYDYDDVNDTNTIDDVYRSHNTTFVSP